MSFVRVIWYTCNKVRNGSYINEKNYVTYLAYEKPDLIVLMPDYDILDEMDARQLQKTNH